MQSPGYLERFLRLFWSYWDDSCGIYKYWSDCICLEPQSSLIDNYVVIIIIIPQKQGTHRRGRHFEPGNHFLFSTDIYTAKGNVVNWTGRSFKILCPFGSFRHEFAPSVARRWVVCCLCPIREVKVDSKLMFRPILSSVVEDSLRLFACSVTPPVLYCVRRTWSLGLTWKRERNARSSYTRKTSIEIPANLS